MYLFLPEQISLTVQMLFTSPYHSLCNEVYAEKLLLYSRGLLWPSLGLVSLSFTRNIKRFSISLWPGTSKGVVWARNRLVRRNTPWCLFLQQGSYWKGHIAMGWLVLPSSLTPQSNQDLVVRSALLSGGAVFQDGTQLFKQMHLQLFLTGIPLTFQKAKGSP